MCNGRLKEARKYISYVKKNKIIIKGDFYVEPTTLHSASGYYMRAWMKYKLYKDADIFEQMHQLKEMFGMKAMLMLNWYHLLHLE